MLPPYYTRPLAALSPWQILIVTQWRREGRRTAFCHDVGGGQATINA
jgi:hypothetical protein